MAQGAENDLVDITYYTTTSLVHFVEDNIPMLELNDNVLTVDDKAVWARDTINGVVDDFLDHVNAGGNQHGNATDVVSGFMSAADRAKLSRIQNEAQVNLFSAVDSLELVGRRETTLHRHLNATTTIDGFISYTDKIKLASVEVGAEVNNISDANALILTDASNADALHTHVFTPFVETFTSTEHSGVNHSGLPGVLAAFPTDGSGFAKTTYSLGSTITGTDTYVFSKPYTFNVGVLDAGIGYFSESTQFGSGETVTVTDVAISGVNGVVTYSTSKGGGLGDFQLACYQSAYGE